MSLENPYGHERLSDVVYHPKAIKSSIQSSNVVEIPTFYNKDERKKMRRLHRQAKEQEKQDKIQLGII